MATVHPPRPGWVRLQCDDPPLDLTVLLGEGSPRLSNGVGGWEVTARPRQVGMTTWAGVEPFQLELPLMFDGWRAGTGQERRLRRLVRVARGDDESPPGVISIDGLILPADEWIIENIDYDEALRSPDSMKRLRQPLTLTLREFVPPKYLQLRKKALQGAKGKTRIIHARTGDTPAKIARRERCTWKDVRELNAGIVRKANQTIPKGTKVRVPQAMNKRKRRGDSAGSRKP